MIQLPAFGLRWKLVLLSGFLFAIPWLGWEYVWEMEKYLRQGQERSLSGTARAVATALHDRPRLFEQNASFLEHVELGRDLYAHQIEEAIQLDGYLNDWNKYRQHSMYYAENYVLSGLENYSSDSLSFTHMVGKFDQFLYAYFQVNDDHLVMRGSNNRSIDRNDFLEIAFLSPQGAFQRYLVTTTRPGWFTAYRLSEDIESWVPVHPEPAILGQWLVSDSGYTIELRIPLNRIGSKIGFSITDVDDPLSRVKLSSIGTSGTRDSEQLGTVLVPSPEIENIIRGMRRSSSRIRVVDQHQRVLASAGNIRDTEGPWSVDPGRSQDRDSYLPGFVGQTLRIIEKRLFYPIYDRLLTRPSQYFIDELEHSTQLMGTELSPALTSALAGQPSSQWRLTSDKAAVILSAAYPIYIDDIVMGGVIAEETTNGIRTMRNRALEKLFNVIVAVMTLGTLALFIFASRVSSRIRKLRNQAEQAIDEQGRVSTKLVASTNRDEIGDLSRSLANIVGRLGGYTNYLESMSSRLSHELRTPVTIVKSSLENMSMLTLDKEVQVYKDRAQSGLTRLTSILANMSEATRIEQTLQNSEKVRFELSKIILSCGDAYRQVYTQFEFTIHIEDSPNYVFGVPEHIAQLLDKLIANAVEFSIDKNSVRIDLRTLKNWAILEVSNHGPQLPEDMQDRIFDSMVSIRSSKKDDEAHLGIGLHIARLITEFHGGEIKARNLQNGKGVLVSARFPLAS